MGDPPIIEMRGMWKEFPGVVANRGINLELHAGEIHALLGENGAGKTTLMNVLSGLYRATAGDILVDGRRVDITSPASALKLGIGMVHQHFRLVPNLSVAENLHLGWSDTPWHPTRARLRERTKAICEGVGYEVNPNAKVWQLSVGEQQRVEILRVLARGARVLILDEPTSVLTPSEAEDLFRVLRRLSAEGKAVVFISHKLDEVMRVSDRVTVLRNGERVTTVPASSCDYRQLARFMVGKNVEVQEYERVGTDGETLLELQGVSALSDRGVPALKGVCLAVHEREIVGIAGVAGNGQSELAEVATGLRPVTSGAVLVRGVDFTGGKPPRFLKAGIGHIPEDRTGVGLVMSESIVHNAILRTYDEPPIRRGLRIDGGEAVRYCSRLMQRARVRSQDVRAPAQTLSGGNQQRLVAGRESAVASNLLVAVHPTRGLDIVATNELREGLVEHRNAGNGVLLISEDLDELLVLSDRILVMYEGQIAYGGSARTADREEVALAMGGVLGVENAS